MFSAANAGGVIVMATHSDVTTKGWSMDVWSSVTEYECSNRRVDIYYHSPCWRRISALDFYSSSGSMSPRLYLPEEPKE